MVALFTFKKLFRAIYIIAIRRYHLYPHSRSVNLWAIYSIRGKIIVLEHQSSYMD